jgi:hypothetical protein
MARAKVGTRMSHITVISSEVDTTWVANNFNGILYTRELNESDIQTEDALDLQTELSATITTNEADTDIEITSIGFVADESESSNSTTGQFLP